MDEKISIEEKQPTEPPKPERRKLTAAEARKTYGIRSLVTFGFWCWFAYDAWLTTDPEMQKHKAFNTVGAIILGLLLVYFLTMFISAALTVRREQQAQPRQP
jgi:succinate-acetate transporter protein